MMCVFTTSKHSLSHCYLLALCLALHVYNDDKYVHVLSLSSMEDGHENSLLHRMMRPTIGRCTGDRRNIELLKVWPADQG